MSLFSWLQPKSSCHLECERDRTAWRLQHISNIGAWQANCCSQGPHGQASESDLLRCQHNRKWLPAAAAGWRRWGEGVLSLHSTFKCKIYVIKQDWNYWMFLWQIWGYHCVHSHELCSGGYTNVLLDVWKNVCIDIKFQVMTEHLCKLSIKHLLSSNKFGIYSLPAFSRSCNSFCFFYPYTETQTLLMVLTPAAAICLVLLLLVVFFCCYQRKKTKRFVTTLSFWMMCLICLDIDPQFPWCLV